MVWGPDDDVLLREEEEAVVVVDDESSLFLCLKRPIFAVSVLRYSSRVYICVCLCALFSGPILVLRVGLYTNKYMPYWLRKTISLQQLIKCLNVFRG